MADEVNGGTVLYGGQLSKCTLLFEDSDECGNRIDSDLEYGRNSLEIITNTIFTIEQDNNSATTISSPAERLCVCDESSSKCDSESQFITVSVIKTLRMKSQGCVKQLPLQLILVSARSIECHILLINCKFLFTHDRSTKECQWVL